MNGESEHLQVAFEEASLRLDNFLISRFPTQSRAYFQSLIQEGAVLVNGRLVKKRTPLGEGDRVEVILAPLPPTHLTPEPIPLSILYEDPHLIVLNKPAGMVVHPGAGNWAGTLVNGLLHHCKQLPEGEPMRPGIVHRLDRETTGVLVAAKSAEAHRALIAQFVAREVEKEYLALSVGDPGEVTIDKPLGRHPVNRKKRICAEAGQRAVTHITPLAKGNGISLLKVGLETGRTHQIRVHLKSVGTPVLGDDIYGDRGMNGKWQVARQMLHAHKIGFVHPITGEVMAIEAPLPSDFRQLCSSVGVAPEAIYQPSPVQFHVGRHFSKTGKIRSNSLSGKQPRQY